MVKPGSSYSVDIIGSLPLTRKQNMLPASYVASQEVRQKRDLPRVVAACSG